ncbi:MAG TPA: electron transfer flavoprotein subunit alpha/FixB family protein [Devosia sp.]|nr:electron transfer flavoprotein subunit alpha/FixB family protein [Devosia sp.]
MSVLLLAEHDNENLSGHTARALSAALRIGGDVDVLVAGENVAPIADQAARLSGIRRVLLADHSALAHQAAEPVAALLKQLADGYDHLVAPATISGKNIMPRLAALLDVMQISDIVDIVSPDTFRRPIYAGNAIQTVQSTDARKVVTVRTSAFDPVGEGEPVPVEKVEAGELPQMATFVGEENADTGRPDLSTASIVISGGRALGSAEKFAELLEPLAARLGAAIGASRAAVDAGFTTNDLQVGQTGKVIAPDLYIACGISGAIQHVAGIKDARMIVAINDDPDAPIFKIADYGLVADIFEALPELEKQL